MVESKFVCLPNFFGRFFGLRRIHFDGQEVILQSGNSKERYPLSDLVANPTSRISWMGGTYHFKTPERQTTLRFLSKDSLQALAAAVNTAIKELADHRVNEAYQQLETSAISQYLRDSHVERLEKDLNTTVFLYEPMLDKHDALSDRFIRQLKQLIAVTPLSSAAESLRQRFEQSQLGSRSTFFSRVESNPLTEKQRLAVIRDNDRNLVLTAAGTGKTSVIVAKALNLIDTGKAQPQDILILAYNNAAAKELQERMGLRAKELGFDCKRLPTIRTFHALGRKVLLDADVVPTLSRFTEDPWALESWATSWFVKAIKSSDYSLKLFIRLLYPGVNPFDFKTAQEYEEYVRDNEYRTLQGELVKGYQELLIANWLYLHCVEYEYEPSYITKRRISAGFDYRPDFHLTGTDIYLEHFGVDRQGHTRPGIDAERYQSEMESKRALHQEQNTTPLETFHYDWVEGNLESSLERQLTQAGITLRERPSDEVFDALQAFGGIAEGVKRYIKCLQAIRVEQLSADDIAERLLSNGVANAEEYKKLLHEFHEAYKAKLSAEKAIDFDDMIIRATDSVLSRKYSPRFNHILVDEFQDISKARMDFLNALIERGPSPILTVVGDDWQSIYRFSGGKLELTTRFDERVGSHTRTLLDKTFRYDNSIAHTAGTFVMVNPEQYTKQISTHEKVSSPQDYVLDDVVNENPNLMAKTRQIVSTIAQQDPGASIAILARYNYLLSDAKSVLSFFSKSCDIKYWAFHGSKGLEADYGIIIGLTHGKLGFPNSRKDEIIVEALLPSLDPFPHSEERRLLYVAITRAKRKCYLVADASAPSTFIQELLIKPEFNVTIASTSLSGNNPAHYKCPNCSNGYLKKLSGKFGDFYSCSSGSACQTNVRVCESCDAPSVDNETYSVCQNESCNRELSLCPRCGRPLREVKGKYGNFIGCSGYGISNDQCTYKRAIISR